MAQLSRPYQILLGAVVVFGLIWAVALRGHAANPSEPTASTSHPATSASSLAANAANGSSGGNPAAPTKIYHGNAPGVEGLTRAISKAHGVVAESQHNVHEQEGKSRALSRESLPSATTTRTTAGGKTTQSVTVTRKATVPPTLAHRTVTPIHRTTTSVHGTTTTSHSTTTLVHSAPTPVHRVVVPKDKVTVHAHALPRSSAKPASGRNPEQVAVEHELAQGKTVMLFFWNPKSTVDQIDQTEAKTLAARSKGTVTLHPALASQVGEFGSITEVVHVYQTPTILIVNKHGLVSTLTGLTDVFALEQSVQEAQSAVS
ncbi:MAG TPA: hypothetical protein VIJ39_11175 [Solirubrobacteraceae bacterium]